MQINRTISKSVVFFFFNSGISTSKYNTMQEGSAWQNAG